MNEHISSLLVIYLCVILLIDSALSEKFFVRDGKVIDDSNRERFFHGVNVVFKSAPYHPVIDHFDVNLSYAAEDMQILQEIGVNVVRLGVMWPGVEPERGMYNTSYIELMKQLIQRGYDYGIYSLVDAHQDLLSEKFCGEGVPLWASQPYGKLAFPLPLRRTPFEVDNETGIPLEGQCNENAWAAYYATEAVSTAFQNLYDNNDNLRTAFGQFWAQLASAYKDLDGVVGFELFNEPWAGDVYSNPKLALPSVADSQNLAPLYEELASAIREVDDDRVVFFESVVWSDYSGYSNILGIGFDEVPGGHTYQNRSVFSYHFYDSSHHKNEEEYIIARVNDATTLGCAACLTEFDLTVSEYTIQTMDLMDSYLQSWMGWSYKTFVKGVPGETCLGCSNSVFNFDGSINKEMCRTIARTYPKAVAGRTKSIQFDSSTGAFSLTFEVDTTISLPTEIYFSEEYFYANGFEITVTPAGSLVWTKSSRNHIHFTFSSSVTSGTQVTISLVPVRI